MFGKRGQSSHYAVLHFSNAERSCTEHMLDVAPLASNTRSMVRYGEYRMTVHPLTHLLISK